MIKALKDRGFPEASQRQEGHLRGGGGGECRPEKTKENVGSGDVTVNVTVLGS